MNEKPYIGITGFTSADDIRKTVGGFLANSISMDTRYIPMLGYLVSYKTLNHTPTDNLRYPLIDDIPDLLRAAEKKALAMIHYNSKELDTLADQIYEIFTLEDIYENDLCSALQLNILWPPVCEIEKIRDLFPGMKIVLQLSEKTIKGKTPKDICDHVADYSGMISYVLIDPSAGQGIEFDLRRSVSIHNMLKDKHPKLTIGFAGGFSDKNAKELIDALAFEVSDFCIDVESGVRDKKSEKYGDDIFNVEKALAYIGKSSKALESNNLL